MAEIEALWQKQRIRAETRVETEYIGNFKIPSDKRINRAKDRKVDFVIAGTVKGGTTALDTYLRLNSEICMPQRTKEINFFDTDMLFRLKEPDYRLYHSFFKPKKPHRLLGEVSPDYMYGEDFARRIHAYNPKMKIILSLRNPIDRAFSHWNMFRELGFDSLPFGEAIRDEEERTRAQRAAGKASTFSYVDRGYYVEQIRRLRRYFSPQQILTIRQDELQENPRTTLDSIWKFLEIDMVDFIEPTERLVGHYPASMSAVDRNHLTGLFQNEVQSLEQMLGWDCSDWLA